MPSINQITLLGHLGRDPELRMSRNSTPFCNFSMATSENRKDASGNWQSDTTWHYVTVFGPTAERIAANVKKGDLIFIQGRLSRRKYQDKEGQEKESVEVLANRATPIVPKSDRPQRPKPTPQAQPSMEFEDDIPF